MQKAYLPYIQAFFLKQLTRTIRHTLEARSFRPPLHPPPPLEKEEENCAFVTSKACELGSIVKRTARTSNKWQVFFFAHGHCTCLSGVSHTGTRAFRDTVWHGSNLSISHFLYAGKVRFSGRSYPCVAQLYSHSMSVWQFPVLKKSPPVRFAWPAPLCEFSSPPRELGGELSQRGGELSQRGGELSQRTLTEGRGTLTERRGTFTDGQGTSGGEKIEAGN